jgi:protein O-mannosyl-transferase
MRNRLFSFFLKVNANIYKQPGWIIFLLLALTAVIYIPVFHNQFTNWDDDLYILENPYLKSLSFDNLKNIFTVYYTGNYHPLTLVSLAIDFKWGGLQPWPYQLTNLLLHLCNILLVYIFIKLLLQKMPLPAVNKPAIALITAGLFGIHPFQVESVAWVSERKNVLYTFFFLASLIVYLKYLDKPSRKAYILSISLFILSLLSKGMALPLSVCIIAIDYTAGRNLFSKKVVLEKIPYLTLSLIFGIIALLAQHSSDATKMAGNFTWLDRTAIASYGFIQYLVKLCYPYQLSAFYPYPAKTATFFPYPIYGYIILVIIALFILWSFFRQHKVVLFGALFFMANISMVIQLLPVGGAMMADRYVYIPSIGFFFIIGYFCHMAGQKNTLLRNCTVVLLVLYGAILGNKTYRQIHVWRDSLTLWNNAIKNYPENNDRAFLKLGVISYHQGKYPEALKYYKQVLNMNLQDKRVYSQAYVNMGMAKWAMKDREGAMEDYNTSLSCFPSYEGYHDRALLKNESGDIKGALADLDEALLINPLGKDAYIDRGIIHLQRGNYPEAMQNFDRVLQIAPRYSKAYLHRGQVKQAMKDIQGAMGEYDMAISITPSYYGYLNRASLKFTIKDFDGALIDIDMALQFDSLGYEAHFDKGLIALKAGDMNTAVAALNKAIGTDTTDFKAYLHRGTAKYNLADYPGAIADLDISIRLHPIASAFYYRGMAQIQAGQKRKGYADLKQSAQLGNTKALKELKKNNAISKNVFP